MVDLPPWSALARSHVRWHVAERSRDGRQIKLGLHVDGAVIASLLDAACGRDAWSFHLRPWGSDGLVATLTIGHVARSASVRLEGENSWPVAETSDHPAGGTGTTTASTDVALWAAASMWGARHDQSLLDDGWVDCDPDLGTPLYFPDLTTVTHPPSDPDVVRGRVDGRAAPARSDSIDDSTGRASATGPATAAATTPATPPAVASAGEASTDDDKPEGRRMIDRLVERLGDAGFGAQAARLVMQHGGYGADAEASRELYADLRALWVRYAGAAGSAAGAPDVDPNVGGSVTS